MEKLWLSVFVATTMFITTEMASVEIMSAPTKVVVMRPSPQPPDDMKIGRSSWNSSEEIAKAKIPEKAKDENFTKSVIKNNDVNSTVNGNNSTQHPEVQNWPSVFVLTPHPTHPVVCYSGTSINIHKNSHDDLEISSIKEVTSNQTYSSARVTKKFVLSSDPEYPVICQEVYIPVVNNGTTEEGNATVSNVTCIRRDYEKNISAIFINEVGPIQSAWNIFNSTIPYGIFNVENVGSIGEIKMLKDTIVDCEEYGVLTGDKGLSPGTAASLLGVG